MKNRTKRRVKKIIKSLILMIIFLILTYFLYNKYAVLHSNYCCIGIDNCKFYMCSTESSKVVEFEIISFFLFFCGAGVILELFHLLSALFKR